MAVTKGKKKERIADTNFKLYVLKLENNKFYIGVSEYPEKRFGTHLKQGKSSSVFCKENKPIKILEILELQTNILIEAEKYENEITFEYLRKYGVANVRGGSFLSSTKRVQKKYLNYTSEKQYSRENILALSAEKTICLSGERISQE